MLPDWLKEPHQRPTIKNLQSQIGMISNEISQFTKSKVVIMKKSGGNLISVPDSPISLLFLSLSCQTCCTLE